MAAIALGQALLTIQPLSPQCMDCGLAREQFPLDIVVPDDQWRQLTGRNDGGGLLCAACLVARAAKLPGVKVARFTFQAAYESRQQRRAREREEAKTARKPL